MTLSYIGKDKTDIALKENYRYEPDTDFDIIYILSFFVTFPFYVE